MLAQGAGDLGYFLIPQPKALLQLMVSLSTTRTQRIDDVYCPLPVDSSMVLSQHPDESLVLDGFG